MSIADFLEYTFTCSFCEKACKTTQGLKSHITKMHLDEQSIGERQLGTDQKKRKITEEVSEVVESLLENIVNMSDDEITVEENVKDENCN